MIEGPDERYQIATCALHCILSGSPNEAAYNTYRAGVMEIYLFLTLDIYGTLVFLSFRRQPVDSRNEEAVNSTRNTIYSLKVFYYLLYRRRYFLFVSELI